MGLTPSSLTEHPHAGGRQLSHTCDTENRSDGPIRRCRTLANAKRDTLTILVSLIARTTLSHTCDTPHGRAGTGCLQPGVVSINLTAKLIGVYHPSIAPRSMPRASEFHAH